MKKYFGLLLIVICVLTLTACGNDEKEESNKNENKPQETEIQPTMHQEENNNVVVDDEIIDIDDEDNKPPMNEGIVTVSEVINCPGCVFAYTLTKSDNIFVPISLHMLHNTLMIVLQFVIR